MYAARLEELQARRGSSRSHFLPTIGIAGGIERNPQVATDAKRVAYGYASWNLFNGFDDRRAVQISGFDVAIAELDLRQARLDMECDVETKFYEVLAASEQLTILEAALQVNASALKDAHQRRGAGISSDSDVVTFEVRGSRLEADLGEAKANIDTAKVEFNRLLGYELGPAIEFSGAIPHFTMKDSFSAILASTKDSSLELRRAAIDISKAETEASRWTAGVLPKIDFEAHNGWLPLGERPTADDLKDAPATSFLLTAKMDLFTGLSTVEDRKAAIARKTQSTEQMRDVSMNIINSLERFWTQLALMQDRILLEKTNAQRTLKLKDTIAREYRAGIKTGADYANAVDLMTDAQQRRLNALLSWHKQRSVLEKMIGHRLAVTEVK